MNATTMDAQTQCAAFIIGLACRWLGRPLLKEPPYTKEWDETIRAIEHEDFPINP